MAILSLVQNFSPPGGLTDFTPEQEVLWSQKISEIFNSKIEGITRIEAEDGSYEIYNNAPRPQFFNPIRTDREPDLKQAPISWVAFPRQVGHSLNNPARWKRADENRHIQDEYCEWSVSRKNQKITSVTFTCESPEYWKFLGDTNPAKVVELYQTYINREVTKEDLFDEQGRYIPQNRWNKDTENGAMHLIQENNSLIAEIELAAGASMVRVKNGEIIKNRDDLIRCGAYGEPERHSDPLIGGAVNNLAREGAMVSLRDPVGLYFDVFKPIGWETPDNTDPASYWKILRGKPDTPVRATYEVPEDKRFTVGDIKIDGKNIQYGSQIADYVHIKLIGIAQNFKPEHVVPFGCVSYKKMDKVDSSLSSALSSMRIRNRK